MQIKSGVHTETMQFMGHEYRFIFTRLEMEISKNMRSFLSCTNNRKWLGFKPGEALIADIRGGPDVYSMTVLAFDWDTLKPGLFARIKRWLRGLETCRDFRDYYPAKDFNVINPYII